MCALFLLPCSIHNFNLGEFFGSRALLPSACTLLRLIGHGANGSREDQVCSLCLTLVALFYLILFLSRFLFLRCSAWLQLCYSWFGAVHDVSVFLGQP